MNYSLIKYRDMNYRGTKHRDMNYWEMKQPWDANYSAFISHERDNISVMIL